MQPRFMQATTMKAIRAVSVMVVLLPGAPAQTTPSVSLALPGELAGYNTWTRLLDDFRGVPMELWLRCMPPTRADWEAARRRSGPHTERVIMVYANRPAAGVLEQGSKAPLPPGAILAKEKRLLAGTGAPDGIAFMVKRTAPEFADTGGWEFLYYPAAGDARKTHERCASCHRGAASTDYVVGDYTRRGAGEPGR